MKCLSFALGSLLFGILAFSFQASAAPLSEELSRYIDKNRSKIQTSGPEAKVTVQVAALPSGEVLFSRNGHDLVSPASVLKLVTSVAALLQLGSGYRFRSDFLSDKLPGESDGNIGNLYFRGGGDPSLVQETLWDWVNRLHAQGVRKVNDVVIDESRFQKSIPRSGLNPYEAAQSAASINHNCLEFQVSPGKVGSSAIVNTTLGAAIEVVNKSTTRKGSGRELQVDQDFRDGKTILSIRGWIGEDAEPYTDYQSVEDVPGFIGEQLRYLLKKAGIEVTGGVKSSSVPAVAKPLRSFYSRDFIHLLRDLNFYSSNFMAEQVRFALGEDDDGVMHPEAGTEVIARVLLELGVSRNEFDFYDASGLSEKNRISVDALTRVLVYAYNDFAIGPDLLSSLSRYGNTGTVKKRQINSNRVQKNSGKEVAAKLIHDLSSAEYRSQAIWAKTGTLNGVSSLAGFLTTAGGQRIAFAIILNGIADRTRAKDFEDGLVGIMLEQK